MTNSGTAPSQGTAAVTSLDVASAAEARGESSPSLSVLRASYEWVSGKYGLPLLAILAVGVTLLAIKAPWQAAGLLFGVLGLSTGWATAAQRRATESLRRSRDELRRTNEALGAENTALRRLVGALRESERILREAEELGQTGSWEHNLLTGDIVNTEGNLRLFFGTDRSKGARFEDYSHVVHPDDRAFVLEGHAQLLAEGRPRDIEYRVVWPDASVHVLFGRATVVRDASGQPLRVHGTNLDITERNRAEEALRGAADRLQQLSRRLLEVQEEERRHLARELHDEFGQLIATITLLLHAARDEVGEGARIRLDECATLLRHAGEQVRSLALELRPTMLETVGLEETLRWLAEQHEQRTGIATQVTGHLRRVSGDLAIACFRLVQEALTNVVRHAQAQHVWIELRQSGKLLELVVRDDGVGFDVERTVGQAARRGHLGLLGMRERVDILGGSVAVQSAAGAGTRIRIAVPLVDDTTESAAPAA